MVRYAGKCKKVYQLEDKPFKSGGEGSIYNIIGESDLVAKIYKNRPSRELEEKILAMVETVSKLDKNFLNICAWPIDALYDTDNKFTGFVMPKINGMQQLKEVFPYDVRKLTWDKYLKIARNLAAAVNNVHEIGQVIGDLNPKNILVNIDSGMLTLIDADSFHVKNADGDVYRCTVGMPEYVASELQGKTFSEIPAEQSFSKDSDNFALAVLIFRILINGAHPFACKTEGKSVSKFQPIDNISSGTCAYFTNSSDISIPPYAPDLSCLPKDMQELFKRAFVDGYKNPSARPSADDWYFALDRLSKQLKTCSIKAEHLYYSGASECPWCSVDRKMMKTSFKIRIPIDHEEQSLINELDRFKSNDAVSSDLSFVCIWRNFFLLIAHAFKCLSCSSKLHDRISLSQFISQYTPSKSAWIEFKVLFLRSFSELINNLKYGYLFPLKNNIFQFILSQKSKINSNQSKIKSVSSDFRSNNSIECQHGDLK